LNKRMACVCWRSGAVALVVLMGVMNGRALHAAQPPARLVHFDAMPKIALLPDGVLAAYFLDHSGPGLGDETPVEQRMMVRYSSDSGVTWSEPEAAFPLPSDAGGFGYHIALTDASGEVHLFVLCDANTGVVRLKPEGTSPRVDPLPRQRLDVWHVKSLDGRSAWSEPRQVWQGRVADLQSVAQLHNGRIVLPFAYLVPRSWGNRGEGFAAFTYLGMFDTTVLYSDDDGDTWHTSPSILNTPTPDLSAYGAVEPVVAQLGDGRVWMLLRTQLGRFYQSFSHDNAETWSPAEPTAILSSDSPAAFVNMPDGRLVMLWNNCQRYPYAQGARRVLHAAVSSDNGRSWRGYREILRDPHRDQPPPPSGDHGVSYPFAIPSPDGEGVIYSLWVQSGVGRSIERFDLDWLTATGRADRFDDGLDGWATHGTRGVTLADLDNTDAGRAMRLAKTDPAWPAAAVWNFPAGSRGRLKMRVMMEPGAGDLLLGLTDHYSPPFDDQDSYFNLFNLPIAADGSLPGGERLTAGAWHDLELVWDTGAQRCDVRLDGRAVASLDLLHRAHTMISYVRVRSTMNGASASGILIDEIEAEVAQP